jgi:hypothetical protein
VRQAVKGSYLCEALYSKKQQYQKNPSYNLFYLIMKILLENFIFGDKLSPVFLKLYARAGLSAHQI